jgi:hypothetical protein
MTRAEDRQLIYWIFTFLGRALKINGLLFSCSVVHQWRAEDEQPPALNRSFSYCGEPA